MEKLPDPEAQEAMSAEAEMLRRVMSNGKRVHVLKNYPYQPKSIMDASFLEYRADENWCRDNYGRLDIDVCRDRWMITVPANMFNPVTSWADLRSDDDTTATFYRAFTYVIDALHNPGIGHLDQTEAGPEPSFLWPMLSRDIPGATVKRPKQHIAVELIIRNHDVYSDDKEVLSDAELFRSNNIVGVRIHVLFLDYTIRPGLYLVAKLWENQIKSKMITQKKYDDRMKMLQQFGCTKFYDHLERYYYDNGAPSTVPTHVTKRKTLEGLHIQIMRDIKKEATELANLRVAELAERIAALPEEERQGERAVQYRKQMIQGFVKELYDEGFVEALGQGLLSQLIPEYKPQRKPFTRTFGTDWNRVSMGGRTWNAGAATSLSDIIRTQMSNKHEDISKNFNQRNPEFTADLAVLISDPEEGATRTILSMLTQIEWVLGMFDGPTVKDALEDDDSVETLYRAFDYNIDEPMSPVNATRAFSFEKSCLLLLRAVPETQREHIGASPQFRQAAYTDPTNGKIVFPYSRLVFQYSQFDFSWERLRNSFLPFFSFSNGIEQFLIALETEDRKKDIAAASAIAATNATTPTLLFPMPEKNSNKRARHEARVRREGDEYDDDEEEESGGGDDGAGEQRPRQPDHSKLAPKEIKILEIEAQWARDNNADEVQYTTPSEVFREARKNILHGNLAGLASKTSVAKQNENDIVKIESCLEGPRKYMEKLALRVRTTVARHEKYHIMLLSKLREEGMIKYLNYMHTSCNSLPKQYLSVVSFFENKGLRSPFQPLFNTWLMDEKTTVFASMMGNILLQLAHSCVIHSNFDTAMRLIMFSIQDQWDMANNRTPLHALLFGETQAGKSLLLYLIRLCTIEGAHQDAGSTSKSARHTMAVQDGLVITSEEGNSLVTTDQAALNPAQQDAANMYKNIMTERSASRVTFYSHPVTKLPLQLAYQTSVRATIIMACDHLENSKHTSNRNRFRLETILPMVRKDKSVLDTLGSSSNPALKHFQNEFFLQRQTQMALNARGFTAAAFQIIPYPDVTLYLIGLNRGITAINSYGIVDFAERGRAVGRGVRCAINCVMDTATGYLMNGEQSPFLTRDHIGTVKADKPWKESDIEKIGRDMFCTTDIAVHALDQTFGDLVDEKVELLIQVAGRGLCGFTPLLFEDLYKEADAKNYFKVPSVWNILKAKRLDPDADMPMFVKEYNALMARIMRLRHERGNNVQEQYTTNFYLQVARTISRCEKRTAMSIISMYKSCAEEEEEDEDGGNSELMQLQEQVAIADKIHSASAKQELVGALGRGGEAPKRKGQTREQRGKKTPQPIYEQPDSTALVNAVVESSDVQTEYNPMFVQFIGTWDQLSAEINAFAKGIMKHSPMLTKDMLQSMSHRKISAPKIKPISQIFEPLEFVRTPTGGKGRNAIVWEEVNIIQLEEVTNTNLISAMGTRSNTRASLFRVKISTHWLYLNKQAIRYEFITQLENKHTRPQRTVLSTTHRAAQMAFHTLDIGPNPNVTLQTTQRDYCATHIIQNFYMHTMDDNSREDLVLQEKIEKEMCDLLHRNAVGEETPESLTKAYAKLQAEVDTHKKKRKVGKSSGAGNTQSSFGSRLFNSGAQPGELFNMPFKMFLESRDPEQILYEEFIVREFGPLPDTDRFMQYPGNRADVGRAMFKNYSDFKKQGNAFAGFSYPRTIIENTQRVMQMQGFMYQDNPNAYCAELDAEVQVHSDQILYGDQEDSYGTPVEFDPSSAESKCRSVYKKFIDKMRQNHKIVNDKAQSAAAAAVRPKLITEQLRLPSVDQEAALEIARKAAEERAQKSQVEMGEDSNMSIS